MDAYSVDGAEAYSAEGDGAEAAPADYNGMNYAALQRVPERMPIHQAELSC